MLGAGAGGLLGHQVGHGALGAIGGALAANLIGGGDKYVLPLNTFLLKPPY